MFSKYDKHFYKEICKGKQKYKLFHIEFFINDFNMRLHKIGIRNAFNKSSSLVSFVKGAV
jgi:hypothetical protein